MVLAVCHRVVRDGYAAEDAFQATFLVLARKAASLTQPELLGNWLYGVAYRTAMKTRREAAKRRAHEAQAVRAKEVGPSEEIDGHDLCAVVDEEINRLPERYRVPVALCYLQGQTNAEAAKRLGCSRGTIATLLARARDKLRRRFTQRGIGLSVGAALGTLNSTIQGGTVPLTLENVTVKAAALLVAGHAQAVGALAAQAAALAKGVSKAMLIEKLKIPVAILIVTALVGTGAGVGIYCTGAPVSEVEESAREAKAGQQNKIESHKGLTDKRSDERSRPAQTASLAGPVPPEERALFASFKKQLPSEAPPDQALVILDKDGHLSVLQRLIQIQPVLETVTSKNGREQTVAAKIIGKSYKSAAVYDFETVRVYDTKGREVDKKELRKRLKEETLALVAISDGPVDPLHLRLYKEDTLIFVPQAPPLRRAGGLRGARPAPPAAPPFPVTVPPGIARPERVDDPEESVPPSAP
jgi:RNA polymerase sigma factor (sigma-70 family)